MAFKSKKGLHIHDSSQISLTNIIDILSANLLKCYHLLSDWSWHNRHQQLEPSVSVPQGACRQVQGPSGQRQRSKLQSQCQNNCSSWQCYQVCVIYHQCNQTCTSHLLFWLIHSVAHHRGSKLGPVKDILIYGKKCRNCIFNLHQNPFEHEEETK